MKCCGTAPTQTTVMVGVVTVLLVAQSGCNRRSRSVRVDADTARIERSPGHTPEIAPTHAGESSQPRWFALTHGPRPQGHERWRYDLTPRQGWSEPVTDGQTAFIGAARVDPEGPSETEVFALDLADGTVRWHVALPGLDERPLRLSQGVVIASVSAFCQRRSEELPGGGLRRCLESGPPAVVGIDASTGREKFRVTVHGSGENAPPGVLIGSRWWVSDGQGSLRSLVLPAATNGPRAAFTGSLGAFTPVGTELLGVFTTRNVHRLALRVPTSAVARWQKTIPGAGECPPTAAAPIAVLPAFVGTTVSGAPRAFMLGSGADLWTVPSPPARVDTCGAIESNVFWQVFDSTLHGYALADGRNRGSFTLPSALSGPLFAALDGVIYLSVVGRLVGIDSIDGHTAVTVPTAAQRQRGLVLYAGRGVVVTDSPGLVIGFD